MSFLCKACGRQRAGTMTDGKDVCIDCRRCLLAAVGVNLTVHLLDEGLPLCRFSTEVPGRWPHGHLWTYVDDYENANCAACLNIRVS